MCVYRENSKIMARITIPYAVADFIDLRERGFYYVDKTDYIPKLEDYNTPILLLIAVPLKSQNAL